MPARSDSNKKCYLSVVAPLKSWGGIEGKLITLFQAFLKSGVNCELICVRGGETFYPERMPSEISIVNLPTEGKLDGTLALAKYLRQTRPSAILTVKDHSAQIAILARMISYNKIPIFVKVTNTMSIVAKKKLKRMMIRRLYPYADQIIANSEGVANDLLLNFNIPQTKVSVIYNPTLTNDIEQRSSRFINHQWFNSSDSIPIILGVGRFTYQKDFFTLLEAFSIIRSEQLCRLVILGDGPLRQPLQDKIKELDLSASVDLPGFVPDALPYMARSSVFVLSSRYEGLSNVLIEALAAGTPVVSTNCPSGSSEILEEGRLGPLVPVGDARAMAEAISSVLSNPPDPQLVQKSLQRFRSDIVAQQYLKVMGLKD